MAMKQLSEDGRKILEALLVMDRGTKHERQSHTERALADAANLDAARTAAACSELTGAGYIASAGGRHWDETTPALTSFRLTSRGRELLS
ncbi:MAG: hypothetical protein M3198_04290 [Actinomycetota bacterium]|nr:hypothetical protein [Actinomycetota bacterium]